LDKYQTRNGHKNYDQGIRVCFAKQTLSKHTFGPAGPKAQTRPTPLFFREGAKSSPAHMGWVRLSRPSLVTDPTSDPAGQQARVVQTTHALHKAKVIKLPSPCFLSSIMKKMQKQKEKRRKALPGDDEGDWRRWR